MSTLSLLGVGVTAISSMNSECSAGGAAQTAQSQPSSDHTQALFIRAPLTRPGAHQAQLAHAAAPLPVIVAAARTLRVVHARRSLAGVRPEAQAQRDPTPCNAACIFAEWVWAP
jgi:hypothetical protein